MDFSRVQTKNAGEGVPPISTSPVREKSEMEVDPFEIKPIKRLIFEHRNPVPFVDPREDVTDRSWFSDPQGLLLGVVLEDRRTKSWACSILDADQDQELTWKRSGRFATQADAEGELKAKMKRVLAKYYPLE